MGIKINTKRVFTFDVQAGEDKATVTFDFLSASERIDWQTVEALKNNNGNDINYFLLNLRCALVAWTGFDDENGNKLEFNTINQMAVFEFVRNDVALYSRIVRAQRGEDDPKNLTTGSQQSSNLDGIPTPATTAQPTEDVEDA